MKKVFLLVALVATAMFVACKSDDDEKEEARPVEYTIVGFTDSQLPDAWQNAEEFGFSIRTDLYITELKGKKEVGYKTESINGTSGDRLSLVAYGADNLRIEYVLTCSIDEIESVEIMNKTFSVVLDYSHTTIRLADF